MTSAARLNDAEVVPPQLAARIGAVVLAFGSFGNLITVIPPTDEVRSAPIGIGLSIAMLLVALTSLIIPWNRLGARWTMACLVPMALLMMIVGNYTDPLPYVAGTYVILIGAWIGVSQSRFMTLLISPVLAVAFYVPLSMGPHSDRLGSSTVIITVVSVALGESLGLLRTRLQMLRGELIRSNQRRTEALTRNSLDVSFVMGSNNQIRFVSPSVRTRFGYTPAELLAIPLDRFLSEMVRGIDPDDLETLIAGTFEGRSETHRYELALKNAAGEWIDIEATVHNLRDDVDVAGIVVHVRDISERRALESDLFYRAYHDDLTGLANRAAFRERVAEELESGNPASVVFMDLDGFKVVNDTLGHRQGDLILKSVADRLVRAAPDGALVARLGGDEFAIVLALPLDEAFAVAGELIESISSPVELDTGPVSVGAKAGVAEAAPGLEAERIMEHADLAMYEAKAVPDLDVVRFEPQLRQHLVDRNRLQNALAEALANDEFVIHYQPQVGVVTNCWTGAEALIRWQRPGSGLVGPGEFISAAEESKIILAMGRWVLIEACREAAAWPVIEGQPLGIGVNVSPRQFVSEGFIHDVHDAIEVSGIDPSRLTVEVTESVLIQDFGLARRVLDALRSLGVSISLDDFGTGYSSLRYLLELPLSVVKIDQSFVRDATTEFGDYSLLQTINRLGHDLGLKTLIEGVETVEQARLISSIAIDRAQGFYYARPMEAPMAREILATGGPAELTEPASIQPAGGLDLGSTSHI